MYANIYYKNNMNICDLYIKYKVADYRGKHTTYLRKKIDETFDKLRDKHFNHKMSSSEKLDLYEIEEYYIN
jgi:hypothetical protein